MFITSVFCNLPIVPSMCFKIFTFEQASFISVNSSFFNQWFSSNLSAHFGKLMLILSIGNSYKILLKILLISSNSKFEQSVGITAVWYFSSNFWARFFVDSEYGESLFKRIINGLFNSCNSRTTLSSAST